MKECPEDHGKSDYAINEPLNLEGRHDDTFYRLNLERDWTNLLSDSGVGIFFLDRGGGCADWKRPGIFFVDVWWGRRGDAIAIATLIRKVMFRQSFVGGGGL